MVSQCMSWLAVGRTAHGGPKRARGYQTGIATVAGGARGAPQKDHLAEVLTALMMPAGSEGSYGDWGDHERAKKVIAADHARWRPPATGSRRTLTQSRRASCTAN